MTGYRAAAQAPFVVRALQARQYQDLAKILVLLLLAPLILRKLAQEVCSSANDKYVYGEALPAGLCAVTYDADSTEPRTFFGAAAYVVRNYGQVYLQLLQLRGDYVWIPSGVWVLLTAFAIGAVASPMAYSRLVLPGLSSVMGTVVPQSLQLGRLLLLHEMPMPYTWRNMRMAPLLRLIISLTFPVSLTVDIASNLAGHVLALACIAVARSKHPSLQASWLSELLLTSACTAALVVTQLWRWQTGSVLSDRLSAAGSSATRSTTTERQTDQAEAHTRLPCAPSGGPNPSRSRADPGPPALRPATSASSIWVDTLAVMCSGALWSWGEAGRHAAVRPVRYRGLVQVVSLRLKLEGVEPHQLPPDWRDRYLAEAASRMQEGSFVTGLYVREGCIELVMDMAMCVGQDGYASDEAGSSSGDSSSSSVSGPMGLDIAALVAALQLPQAPTSVTAAWVGVGSRGVQPGERAAVDDGLPRIVTLQPRVVAVGQRQACSTGADAGVAGVGPSNSLDLSMGMLLPPQLTTCHPFLQQQKQQQQEAAAMPKVLLRAHDAYLGCTVTSTTPAAAATMLPLGQGAAAGAGSSLWQPTSQLPAAAAAAVCIGNVDLEPFHVRVRASGLPTMPGLLLVDCRCLAARCGAVAPVLLVDDAAVAQELQASLEHWPAPLEQLDQLLADLGAWAQCARLAQAAQAVSSGRPAGSTGRDAGVAQVAAGAGRKAGSCSEGAGGRPLDLDLLGARLLQDALARGWLHTACWLTRGLQARGVLLHQLEPGKLLTRGSPNLLRAALTSRRPAVIRQAMVWSMQSRIPTHLLAKAALRNRVLSHYAVESAIAAAGSGGNESSSKWSWFSSASGACSRQPWKKSVQEQPSWVVAVKGFRLRG